MKMVRMLLFAAAITMPAYSLMQAYSVEPVMAAWSGKVWGDPQYGGVGEVLTVNFDLPITAALFCGASGAGGDYQVSILTYPGDIESGLDVV
ncbi:MAG: hypothetical protein JSU73_03835 [candidate division WOR-3 bacterium]|nr:MAG: hypothetical protein JSU73_03835 [candidate division WOR-3 bacterium]